MAQFAHVSPSTAEQAPSPHAAPPHTHVPSQLQLAGSPHASPHSFCASHSQIASQLEVQQNESHAQTMLTHALQPSASAPPVAHSS
jgi:hypothetical protein